MVTHDHVTQHRADISQSFFAARFRLQKLCNCCVDISHLLSHACALHLEHQINFKLHTRNNLLDPCLYVLERLDGSLLKNGKAEFIDWRSFFAQNLPCVLPCPKVRKTNATPLATVEVVCRKWEDVNHEAVNSVAGALTNAQGDTESDPLGLRRGSIAEWVRYWRVSIAAWLIETIEFGQFGHGSQYVVSPYIHDLTLIFWEHRGIDPYIFQIIWSQVISFSFPS